KTLIKSRKLIHQNKLIEGGCHLTYGAWKVAIDLVVANDDDKSFGADKVVKHLRVKTVVVQEYSVELLVKEHR
ncbi:hypothetical protein MUK42_08698, partial [Musa troglodytarum]